jgi:hypothetical protein
MALTLTLDKTVGHLGVGPVFAGQRKAAAGGAGDVGQKLAQSPIERLVPKRQPASSRLAYEVASAAAARGGRAARLGQGPAPWPPCRGGQAVPSLNPKCG